MSVTEEDLKGLVRKYDETARAHEEARVDLAEGMLAAHRQGMRKTDLLIAVDHRFTWTTLERLLKAAAGIDETVPTGPGYLRRRAAKEAAGSDE